MKEFPVHGSLIRNACAFDAESLEKIVLEASTLENSDYFRQTGLSKYTKQEWIRTE